MSNKKVIALEGGEGRYDSHIECELLQTYNDLMQCASKKMYLSGKIERVVKLNNCPDKFKIAVFVSYNRYRVYIPLFMMGFPEESEDYFISYAKAMIGSTVDFKVLDIDQKNRVAIASRVAAMEIKRDRFYYSEESIIKKAYNSETPIEARIIAQAPSSVRVDVFGVDAKIHIGKLAGRFLTGEDLRTHFPVGKVIKVKIMALNIDTELRTIDISVSAKAAYPDDTALRISRFSIGDIVSGEVTQIVERGYFVAVGDCETGIDIFCARVDCFAMPGRGDTVVCKVGLIDSDSNRVFGRIENVLRRS